GPGGLSVSASRRAGSRRTATASSPGSAPTAASSRSRHLRTISSLATPTAVGTFSSHGCGPRRPLADRPLLGAARALSLEAELAATAWLLSADLDPQDRVRPDEVGELVTAHFKVHRARFPHRRGRRTRSARRWSVAGGGSRGVRMSP